MPVDARAVAISGYGWRVDRIEPERRAPFAKSPTVGAGGAKTQRRILEAGLEVFGTQGFHAASIDTITQLAGCSRASFYQYFEPFGTVFHVKRTDIAP